MRRICFILKLSWTILDLEGEPGVELNSQMSSNKDWYYFMERLGQKGFSCFRVPPGKSGWSLGRPPGGLSAQPCQGGGSERRSTGASPSTNFMNISIVIIHIESWYNYFQERWSVHRKMWRVLRSTKWKKGNSKSSPFNSMNVQVRSKPELIKLLGDTVDLSTFDYSTGTMNSTLIKPRGRKPNTAKDKVRPRLPLKHCPKYWLTIHQGDREDVLRANRTQTANLVPPIRQTASIFKQPVTVVKVGSLYALKLT